MMKIHIHAVNNHLILTDTVGVEIPPQHVHVLGSRVVAVGVDPVLGLRVLVAQGRDRDARDRILGRGDAVAFGGLLGQEPHRGRVA